MGGDCGVNALVTFGTVACHHGAPKSFPQSLALPSGRDGCQVPIGAVVRPMLDDKEANEIVAYRGFQHLLTRLAQAIAHPALVTAADLRCHPAASQGGIARLRMRWPRLRQFQARSSGSASAMTRLCRWFDSGIGERVGRIHHLDKAKSACFEQHGLR